MKAKSKELIMIQDKNRKIKINCIKKQPKNSRKLLRYCGLLQKMSTSKKVEWSNKRNQIGFQCGKQNIVHGVFAVPYLIDSELSRRVLWCFSLCLFSSRSLFLQAYRKMSKTGLSRLSGCNVSLEFRLACSTIALRTNPPLFTTSCCCRPSGVE